MIDEITSILSDHLLFKSFSREQLASVCKDATFVSIEKNGHLFEQGEKASCFYYLCSGQVKLSRISRKGDEKIIEILHQGDTFAEALMFLKRWEYPVAAQALNDSTLIRIHFDSYQAVLSESVETCLALLGDVSSRMHELINEIERLTLHNASCRLSSYLSSLAPDEGGEFVLDVPKLALASRLAISPETFSRIIGQLCKNDLIRVDRNKISILDSDGLKAFSEDCVEFRSMSSDSSGGNLRRLL
jgi:CRP-like cAMP-binding protein